MTKWLYNDTQMVTLDRVADVASALGGRPALGVTVRSNLDMDRLIREGMPSRVLSVVRKKAGLTARALGDMLGIAPTTLQRRKRQRRLSPEESERLYRLGRVLALGQQAFGSLDALSGWLTQANASLGGRSPSALLRSEAGARTVEGVLGRMLFGGYD